MRRKVNPQISSYVQNNELICFGLSEHTVEEHQSIWTPEAKKDLSILASWFPKRKMEEVVRPAYRSEYNYTANTTRANLRCLLGLLVIRELPIKRFYVRTMIGYVWITYFIIKGVGRGFFSNRPIFFYNNDFHNKSLLNYPDLWWWQMTRVLPKNPPVPDPHIEWRNLQQPIFHQYHKNVYRYRFRKPRFVQWDGSMNQPVMPYMHDHGTDVPNGTFRRNCNSDAQLR
jgi:hypothetical protein